MKKLAGKYSLLTIGILVGVLYGLLTRLVFDEKATLASITYLFFIPAVFGTIPLIFANDGQLKSYRNIIFIPWICVATFFLTMYLMGIEEIICLLILGGPFFVLGTVGALIYKLIKINRQKRKGTLMTILLLPFIFAPIEELITAPSQEYCVVSEVTVKADPRTIWNQIIRVPAIGKSEYKAGVFNDLGIPRPIEATLVGEQIGAQRTGRFQNGLQFIETIREWKPNEMVAFDIRVDPETIRSNVFDQHILNGNYFKFVNATYELERNKDGTTTLRLISSYKLTSKINFYGKFWGDWILSDFQGRLLMVIKKRCEKQKVVDSR